MGKGPGCRRGEGEKGNTPQGPVGKGPRESCGKRAQVPRGLWVRGAERCGGAGKRPGRGEKTGAHRRELWVAAPHPMRPLSHTHPPRGALLGLATVRGLAAAAAAPQQQRLLLWLRLHRRPRPSTSVARPARAPGRCSRARAASAGDRSKGWKSLRRPRCARAARLSTTHTHRNLAPARVLRTRRVTSPPPRAP